MIGDPAASLAAWWAPVLAFVAGFVSFASPCVLPLVPGYVSFVTGESIVDGVERGRRRLLPMLLFVGGFTVVFVLFGAFASTFVQIFKGRTGQIVAGLIVVAMGALLIGYARRRGSLSLYAERRPFLGRVKPGTAGAFPLGMAFAAGWTPCIGPVLGAILFIASQQSAARGAFLLACYSLGLGVPFVLIGLGAQWLTGSAAWIQRHYEGIAVVSGALLIVVGVLIASGQFTRALAPLLRFTPGL
jgi:cytochrome c-type biogenesis protein